MKDHTFFAYPNASMNKMLQMQRIHTNLTNEMLFSQCQKMNVELRRLEAMPTNTIHDVIRFEVANV